jgi:hypothetical protein
VRRQAEDLDLVVGRLVHEQALHRITGHLCICRVK